MKISSKIRILARNGSQNVRGKHSIKENVLVHVLRSPKPHTHQMKKERDASHTARRRIVLLAPILHKIHQAFQWLCITSIPIRNATVTSVKVHINVRNLERGFRRSVLLLYEAIQVAPRSDELFIQGQLFFWRPDHSTTAFLKIHV